MSTELNANVRERLDAHLDAVEKALVDAKCSRERRRGIVDDLEAQIMDMLAARSPQPAMADLEAVLATLDPPAAYGDASAAPRPQPVAAPQPPACASPRSSVRGAPFATPGPAGTRAPFATPKPRLSGMAVAGFLCVVVSMLLSGVALIFVAAGTYAAWRNSQLAQAFGGQPVEQVVPGVVVQNNQVAFVDQRPVPGTWAAVGAGLCALTLPVPLGLIGTMLGWMAFGRIRASNGLLYGRGLALFDGCFYPAVCALFLLVLLPVPMLFLMFTAGIVGLVIWLTRRTPARA